jgi:hypothetical protein
MVVTCRYCEDKKSWSWQQIFVFVVVAYIVPYIVRVAGPSGMMAKTGLARGFKDASSGAVKIPVKGVWCTGG